jgi:hypothetical protein
VHSGRARNGARFAEDAVAPALHLHHGVSSDEPSERTPQTVIYRFTVQRGMAIALVIETPDWYAGLLQSALARSRVEGQN